MQVQPTQIHGWINTALSQVECVFETPRAAKTNPSKQDETLAALREILASEKEMIAELMEEKHPFKKSNGEY